MESTIKRPSLPPINKASKTEQTSKLPEIAKRSTRPQFLTIVDSRQNLSGAATVLCQRDENRSIQPSITSMTPIPESLASSVSKVRPQPQVRPFNSTNTKASSLIVNTQPFKTTSNFISNRRVMVRKTRDSENALGITKLINNIQINNDTIQADDNSKPNLTTSVTSLVIDAPQVIVSKVENAGECQPQQEQPGECGDCGEPEKKKKKKGFTALKDMVPLNLDQERAKFFELNFEYNPQFDYTIEDLNQKFAQPHKKYLRIAELILDRCVRDYEDDEIYIKKTGGELCTQEAIEARYDEYTQDLGLEKYLNLVFSEKIVSSACCLYRWKGKGTIMIAVPIVHREKKLQGVLDHEIGTHYIRKFNNRYQPWKRNRGKFGLSNCLIIEEGLALLNQMLGEASDPEGKPYLYSAALHYYACYKSSILSFQDLFKDLEKYIRDPVKRWKECIRVKRGIRDTSKAGGMYKDQAYLRGSIEILKDRNKIDFIQLHAGKLNLQDYYRMAKKGLIKTEKMRIPAFLRDMDKYKAALDKIASFNLIDTVN